MVNCSYNCFSILLIFTFYRVTTRASAVHAMALRLSVCLSVTSLSSVKRQNVTSRKQRHTTDYRLEFSDAKDVDEILTG